mmetsp:Transcript_26635/g.61367  ORF Transcript_26635/g.61367 Transcript_26635/m.61367 type:complete len:90 (-) Transcript_26635:236-505(-)
MLPNKSVSQTPEHSSLAVPSHNSPNLQRSEIETPAGVEQMHPAGPRSRHDAPLARCDTAAQHTLEGTCTPRGRTPPPPRAKSNSCFCFK